jgi:uncharacterized protein (DUF305 family)
MRRPRRMLAGGALLLLTACGQSAASPDGGAMPMASQMAGMEHSGTDHSSMISDAPYDAQFIDGMIVHHQGAIDMSEEALEQSERPEIRQMAQTIIADQQREIEQMQQWRGEWFPDLDLTGGTGMAMGDMSVSDGDQPYDQRWIAAMIAHHQGALAMARDAQQNAERAEIQQLAGAIITAQEAEIQQLEQWQREWFGE